MAVSFGKTGRRWRTFLAFATAISAATASRGATVEQVDTAINKAKAYLYSQLKNGTWEKGNAPVGNGQADPNGGQWGGYTAMATYALLASGDRPNSQPLLVQPIEFLKTAKILGIYALGLQAQVWDFLPSTPDVREVVARDGEILLKAMGAKESNRGFYAYTTTNTDFHHSPSQYGVLGMWACNQAGLEVPTKYWSIIDEAWRHTQSPEGGWAYHFKVEPKNPVKASMTAAGVATLFITQDYLDQAGTGTTTDQAIEKGLSWMSDNFKQVQDLYTWYGVERIGTASGYKYFGTIDWFKEGSDRMVKSQQPDGSWGGNYGAIPDTAFALLFLSRGRAPVVLNKLQYNVKGKPGNWNGRRRDGANLVRWLGKQMERDLNWQIVNLEVPVEELHDAPILYLSGSQALAFSAPEEQKLRDFVEQGGIILGNADQNSGEFSASFRKLGTKLFHSYEFRELPANHLIYTAEQYPRAKWSSKPNVMGLSNGIREMMLLVPNGDPGKAWQLQNYMVKPEAFQLMSDIFLYAVDKQNLHYKGASYIEAVDPKVKATDTIHVARLKYAGNWDPEPGGWRRLANVMHNQNHIDLDVQTVALGEGALNKPATGTKATVPASKPGYSVAHLTGTVKFDLSPIQADELKKFVAGGGTLVIDAAGGSSEFATSAEDMLRKVFGTAAGTLEDEMKPDDPIYHLPNAPLGEVEYRSFARQVLGRDVKTPHLRGIKIDGRTAIIYSREDLSEGLVGQPVDGIIGYTPKSATALMADLVLYSSPKTAAAAAATAPKPAPTATATTKPAKTK